MAKLEIDINDETVDKLVIASLREAMTNVINLGGGDEEEIETIEALEIVLDFYGYTP
jgi:hypothetical protein